TRDFATSINRMAEAASFYLLIPGPKLIWQFGELGYDYSINYCSYNGSNSEDCRTGSKPVRWDYFQNASRKDLYNKFSKIIKLKLDPSFSSTFFQIDNNRVRYDFSGNIKWLNMYGENIQVVVLGNFDVATQTSTVNFSSLGTWYSLFDNVTYNVNNYNQQVTLNPGEFYILTNRNIKQNQINAIVATGTGSGIINGGGGIDYGNNRSISVQPNSGSKLDSVLVNGRKVFSSSTDGFIYYPNSFNYTFENVRADSTIQSYFSSASLLSSAGFLSKSAPTNTASVQQVLEPKILLYPNPTRGLVNLSFDNFEGFVEINVYWTNNNRKVLTQKANISRNNNIVSFNLSNFPIGFYMINVAGRKSDGTMFSKVLSLYRSN
ncbi:MAG: hypothetical protein ORN58_08260, partial [Sediminibacterium sp.]|nr:hypothetical protein [Sediminibacterium sp.]